MKNIDARVSLKLEGAENPKVIALDENGYATDKAVIVTDGNPACRGFDLPYCSEINPTLFFFIDFADEVL